MRGTLDEVEVRAETRRPRSSARRSTRPAGPARRAPGRGSPSGARRRHRPRPGAPRSASLETAEVGRGRRRVDRHVVGPPIDPALLPSCFCQRPPPLGDLVGKSLPEGGSTGPAERLTSTCGVRAGLAGVADHRGLMLDQPCLAEQLTQDLEHLRDSRMIAAGDVVDAARLPREPAATVAETASAT